MPVLLVTACGTLAWMIGSLLLSPDSAVQTSTAKPAKVRGLEELTAELKFSMPPLSNYDGILDRPIFSSTRRGLSEGIVAPTLVVSRELKLKLTGTSISDTEKYALLAPQEGGEVLRLREGEDYQGWTLARVKNATVVFRRSGAEERLTMDFVEPPTQVTKRKRRRAGGQRDQRQPQRTLSRNEQGKQTDLRNRNLREDESEGEEDEDEP